MPIQFSVTKWLLIGSIITSTGCLPYTNRTRYDAFNIMPTQTTTADSTQPIVVFSLNRELTSKVYPLVGYLGEKGDFALGVQLYGAGARPYQGLRLRRLQILSGGQVLFSTTDTAFVQAQPVQTPEHYYYKSAPVIALADSVIKPSIIADYDLITTDNRRVPQTLSSRWHMDRKRGFDGY